MTYNSKLHSLSKANRFENGEINHERGPTKQRTLPLRDRRSEELASSNKPNARSQSGYVISIIFQSL